MGETDQCDNQYITYVRDEGIRKDRLSVQNENTKGQTDKGNVVKSDQFQFSHVIVTATVQLKIKIVETLE